MENQWYGQNWNSGSPDPNSINLSSDHVVSDKEK